jgi:DNA-binding PadR family transcriptional regulator
MRNNFQGDQSWRRFEAMARKGFYRMAGMGRFGDWGGFGEGNFRIGRMLASGDLRLVALFLIEQQPRHGYDLIKAIEEKSHGFYSPSPGIVYPALTFLEEAGYVTSASEGNKRLYTITEEGRAHLADNRQAIESTLNFLSTAGERMAEWRGRFRGEQGEDARAEGRPDQDMADVLPEVNRARRALKDAIAEGVRDGTEAQKRIADILNAAAAKIRAGRIDL